MLDQKSLIGHFIQLDRSTCLLFIGVWTHSCLYIQNLYISSDLQRCKGYAVTMNRIRREQERAMLITIFANSTFACLVEHMLTFLLKLEYIQSLTLTQFTNPPRRALTRETILCRFTLSSICTWVGITRVCSYKNGIKRSKVNCTSIAVHVKKK